MARKQDIREKRTEFPNWNSGDSTVVGGMERNYREYDANVACQTQ